MWPKRVDISLRLSCRQRSNNGYFFELAPILQQETHNQLYNCNIILTLHHMYTFSLPATSQSLVSDLIINPPKNRLIGCLTLSSSEIKLQQQPVDLVTVIITSMKAWPSCLYMLVMRLICLHTHFNQTLQMLL